MPKGITVLFAILKSGYHLERPSTRKPRPGPRTGSPVERIAALFRFRLASVMGRSYDVCYGADSFPVWAQL